MKILMMKTTDFSGKPQGFCWSTFGGLQKSFAFKVRSPWNESRANGNYLSSVFLVNKNAFPYFSFSSYYTWSVCFRVRIIL